MAILKYHIGIKSMSAVIVGCVCVCKWLPNFLIYSTGIGHSGEKQNKHANAKVDISAMSVILNVWQNIL